MKEQMIILQKQRFEDGFFKLLENHHRIVEAMDLYDEDKEGNKTLISVKRDCFRTFYNHMKAKTKLISEELTIDSVNKIYDETQEFYKSDLHHYFRFIYHTIKFVKNSKEINDDEKYKYTSILRATMSPYELVLVFYNCLHEFGDTHFKPLVEEFSFLKNIDKTLLFIKVQDEDYHAVAFAKSGERPALLLKWIKEQRQKKSESTFKHVA